MNTSVQCTAMQKGCKQCANTFETTSKDRQFYEKMQVPHPTLCPNCRLQRRLAWRMEWTMYMRICDLSGKEILAAFPPDSIYKVYGRESFYSDKWDPLSYGRDFDFNRTFFDQFDSLLRDAPHLAANISSGLQNCEYVNQCGWSKNCYYTIEADENEDSMYCYRVTYVKNCVDCLEIFSSERCYECTDSERCFRLLYSKLCEQCQDSAFLFDCRACRHCFGCVGLRQKSYCMFNEQLSKEEYEKRMASFDFCDPLHVETAKKRLDQLKKSHPRKALTGHQNEQVSGNYIYQSKDCRQCYNVRGCRDCAYCDTLRDSRDCMDYFVWGANAERIYESQCCGYNAHNLRFCHNTFEGVFDMTYCFYCVLGANHCFGCASVKKNEYCILNKKYSKKEYEALIPKIIAHMQATGEWGEAFPISISPHGYNETKAQELFPITKEDAQQKHWKWRDALPYTTGKETIRWENVPTAIEDVPDSICDEVLACTQTGRNYRITKQELAFYRQMRLPLPRLHFEVRHRKRETSRNPRTLFTRTCRKCGKEMLTTFAPDRPEIVYCERCYLEAVY